MGNDDRRDDELLDDELRDDELQAHHAPGLDRMPDVRDGLTRVERVILWQLHEAQKERGDRGVPTALLYGRVVEHVNISVEELQRVLARLTGGGGRLT